MRDWSFIRFVIKTTAIMIEILLLAFELLLLFFSLFTQLVFLIFGQFGSRWLISFCFLLLASFFLLLIDDFFDLLENFQLLLVECHMRLILFVLFLNLKNVSLLQTNIFEKLRPRIFVSFLHNIFIAQLFFDFFNSLDICVSNFTVLVWVAFFNFFRPLDAVEFKEKIKYEQGVDEIDKCKPNSALCLDIFGQVEVVVLVFEFFINYVHHLVLSELDWNISDHQGRLF